MSEPKVIINKYLIPKNIILEIYEQGKADGERELWEKMTKTCANSHCEHYMEHMCQTTKIETCPIAKGGNND